MRTNLRAQVLRNIGSNWFGLAVTVAIGFFLSPFILRKLGDNAFGLWILIFSITGYYGIFDLGIRSSIVKYVANYAGVRDYEQLRRLVNTSLFCYSCIAAAMLATTGLGSWYVDSVFRIAPGFVHPA